MMKLEVNIQNIYLGIKKGNSPKDDVHQYIEIDELEMKPVPNEIYLVPKKWHINEFHVKYCTECLKQGISNEDNYSSCGKERLCKNHHCQKKRLETPDMACPKCKEGILTFGTGYLMCSHCNHTEPHRHSKEDMQSPNFACTCCVFTSPESTLFTPIETKVAVKEH